VCHIAASSSKIAATHARASCKGKNDFSSMEVKALCLNAEVPPENAHWQ